ncbi:MAG: FecR family protein [Cyanobacteria bacterium P01_A01_bin.123]
MNYALFSRSLMSLALILATTLAACQGQSDSGQTSTPTVASDTQTEPAATSSVAETTSNIEAERKNDATITQVQQPSIWVKSVSTQTELEAQVGTGLIFGDILRTEADALAEVALSSGLAFRLGGNASLVLQPDNRMELSSGQIIAWVEPGKQVPTEIVTPAGVAGLRGTTIFIEISDEPEPEVHILAWEGTITFTVPGESESLVLEGGQGLRLRAGETDLPALRNRIASLNRRQIRQQRQQSRLLNNFDRPIPTQPQIDQVMDSISE